jgi:hypothetical protein
MTLFFLPIFVPDGSHLLAHARPTQTFRKAYSQDHNLCQFTYGF